MHKRGARNFNQALISVNIEQDLSTKFAQRRLGSALGPVYTEKSFSRTLGILDHVTLHTEPSSVIILVLCVE